MKSSRSLLIVLVVLFLLSSFNEAYCQDYLEYQIQISNDNSTSWSIIQASDINAPTDSWEDFQQRIFTLVDTAANTTNREMAIEPETIQMETAITWETQSRTTEFKFKWINFSKSENGRLSFGDIFQVQSFFAQLYGDGTLQITYPVGYAVLSISPEPDNQDDNSRTLEWYRTQDFLNGKPSLSLTSNSQTRNGSELLQIAILGIILTTAAAILIGLYIVRRPKPKTPTGTTLTADKYSVDSDQEKVIKFIKSQGGSTRQSHIKEHFGFSKAKTSQLLASLETQGILTRYKRGRDKIVSVTEQKTDGKS